MEANPKLELKMEFLNLDEAWNFWSAYGGRMSFGVRKDSHNKCKKGGKIVMSMRYVCSNEGFRKLDKRDVNTKKPREETRTGCMARMVWKLVDGKYKVKQFIEEHNHELHTTETSHMLPSQ